jgi:Haem-NO-binding
MYGLVNRALADLVKQRAGADVWERLKAEAGVEVDVFLSLERYPDETTVALVVAAARALGRSPEQLLEEFGRHWVTYAASHGYQHLLHARGTSFFRFLAGLDQLHTRLSLSFPELQPPSFTVHEVDSDTIRLVYESARSGLVPFVVGLLHGVAALFQTELVVTHEVRKQDGAPHDELRIQTRPTAP